MQQASTPKSLLRRTAVALAAAAALLISIPASAANVTFSGASAGETCAYASMSVDPAGNVVVSCSAQATGGLIGSGGTPPPPPPPATGPDTFTLSAPVSTVATNGTFTAVITRTGVHSTTDVGLNIAVIGACSSTAAAVGGGGSIVAHPTDNGPFSIPVVAGATGGTCTILFNVGYGGGVPGGSTQLNITVGASTTPVSTPTGTNPGPVAGCPAPDASMTSYVFPATPGQRVDNNGFSFFVLPPNAVGTLPLPKTLSGQSGGQVQLTYGTYTASTQTLVEISISKCPGVIDNTGGSLTGSNPACYFSSFTAADAQVDWVAKLINGATVSASKCMALESNGTFYANIRYTYTTSGCTYGGGNGCGEQIQWNGRF